MVGALFYLNQGSQTKHIPKPSKLSRPGTRLLLRLAQLLQNGRLERLGLGRRRPAPLDTPVLADQELFEVPLDRLDAHDAGLLLLEPLPHGVGAGAVDVDLFEHGKADAVVDLAEALDLIVGARVLAAELVAGEAEDDKVVAVLLADALVEGLESGELRGEAALGGRVDDEDDLALVVGEGNLGALLCGVG